MNIGRLKVVVVMLGMLMLANVSASWADGTLRVENDTDHRIQVLVRHESHWGIDMDQDEHHWQSLGWVSKHTHERFQLGRGRYRIRAYDSHGKRWPSQETRVHDNETTRWRFYSN